MSVLSEELGYFHLCTNQCTELKAAHFCGQSPYIYDTGIPRSIGAMTTTVKDQFLGLKGIAPVM